MPEKTLEEFKNVYAMIEEFYKKLPAKAKSWVDDNWRSIQEKMIEDIATFVTDEMNIHNCDECDELCDYDEGTICGDCDHCSSCGCVCEEDCLAKNPRCSCGLLLNEDDMRAWDRGKSKIPMCEGCLSCDYEAPTRECVVCHDDFTPSMEHDNDTVCDECVSEKGEKQILKDQTVS